jgi:hypothetical protein
VSAYSGALLARKTWRTLEPLHAMIYFAPEARDAYARLGLTGHAGYFASRAAPMGAVTAEVVVATFFNFNPELIHAAIPRAWEVSSPRAFLVARLDAVDGAFRRVLGDQVIASAEMRRAAELARRVAEQVGARIEGRPLCAGYAGLPWPEAPHVALWHAQSILREFRGDGHIALLLARNLSGIEALVTHGALGDVPHGVLRSTRGWDDGQWNAALASLRQRGWLADGDHLELTAWGAAQRKEIEDQTDTLAAAPYVEVGEEACGELRSLTRPWSKVFAEVLSR